MESIVVAAAAANNFPSLPSSLSPPSPHLGHLGTIGQHPRSIQVSRVFGGGMEDGGANTIVLFIEETR